MHRAWQEAYSASDAGMLDMGCMNVMSLVEIIERQCTHLPAGEGVANASGAYAMLYAQCYAYGSACTSLSDHASTCNSLHS